MSVYQSTVNISQFKCLILVKGCLICWQQVILRISGINEHVYALFYFFVGAPNEEEEDDILSKSVVANAYDFFSTTTNVPSL